VNHLQAFDSKQCCSKTQQHIALSTSAAADAEWKSLCRRNAETCTGNSCKPAAAPAASTATRLHCIHCLVFCFQYQLDCAMRSPAQVLDDQVLVHKHIALQEQQHRQLTSTALHSMKKPDSAGHGFWHANGANSGIACMEYSIWSLLLLCKIPARHDAARLQDALPADLLCSSQLLAGHVSAEKPIIYNSSATGE
jgi:hypothetical protein